MSGRHGNGHEAGEGGQQVSPGHAQAGRWPRGRPGQSSGDSKQLIGQGHSESTRHVNLFCYTCLYRVSNGTYMCALNNMTCRLLVGK